MNDLPIDVLRTFVAVVETGTMAKAARIVARTPSAVSLQMLKLAEIVGKPLFREQRCDRGLTLAGETVLRYAREFLSLNERALKELHNEEMQGPVRFGTVQDLADTLLSGALAEFAESHPAVTLEVQVGTSAFLLDEADGGKLDFVVCFESKRARRIIRREPLVWLGRAQTALLDPVPVAILQPQCALCDQGIDALERAGRRHRIVLRTPSLSGLRAALDAGLAIGSRTPLLRTGNIEVLGDRDGLPPLPEVAFAIYVPRALSPAARRVAGVVRNVISNPKTALAEDAPQLTVVVP